MKGLYCTGNTVANQHIDYLLSCYPDTSMVADNVAPALACLETSGYELLLLEYEETGPFTMDYLETIAAVARRLRPCCVIILYWDYPPVSTAVLRTFPKSLYDFGISKTYDISALLGAIDILKHRRRFFFRQGQTTPTINGIIFGPDLGLNHLYHAQLSRMGFEVILSADIDILEKNIDALEPDFFLSHCHTNLGDFDRIKKLCQRIRTGKPACNIFITISRGVDDDYKAQHQLEAYGYDLLINTTTPVSELVSLILAGEAKKYSFAIPA